MIFSVNTRYSYIGLRVNPGGTGGLSLFFCFATGDSIDFGSSRQNIVVSQKRYTSARTSTAQGPYMVLAKETLFYERLLQAKNRGVVTRSTL